MAEAATNLPRLTHSASTPKPPHRVPKYKSEVLAGR